MKVNLINNSDDLQKILDNYYYELSNYSTEEKIEKKKKYKQRGNPYQHLKTALLDWRVEKQWSKENSVVATIDNTTFIFVTFTNREPRHVTIRHIMSLPQANKGQATFLIKQRLKKESIDRGVYRLRMFQDKKSEVFYDKIGYGAFHGKSKTGLKFYYGDLEGNLINLPSNQKRYIVNNRGLF